MKKSYIIKSRWWEFWKPSEKVIVINDCTHTWIKVEEIILRTWGDVECGKRILLMCMECGDMVTKTLRDTPE